jgi:hypothetical protein
VLGSVGRIIANDNNQIAFSSHSRIELIDTTHHEATIASKQYNGSVWIAMRSTYGLSYPLPNGGKVITHVKAVWVINFTVIFEKIVNFVNME